MVGTQTSKNISKSQTFNLIRTQINEKMPKHEPLACGFDKKKKNLNFEGEKERD